jgi:hypothetical protein
VIVLDEQLLGRGLESAIGRWYRGPVCSIIDLRPQSVIKDEAVPGLLRLPSRPTFVTINERDFWHPMLADNRYCMVCFAIPDSRAREIPPLLRALLRRAEFRTKAARSGKVIRVARQEISFYAAGDRTARRVP